MPAAGTEKSAEEIRAREALITGKPPRIKALRPEEFTDEMRQVAKGMGQLGATPASQDESKPNEAASEAAVLEMIGILIRHPQIYDHHLKLARLFFHGDLPLRDRELAILRVGWLTQAPFEWGEHVTIGKQIGISDDEIARVKQGSSAPGWSDRERAIVAAVEELIGDAMISDETWAVLAEEFDERQLIELVMLVGQYQTVAYYQNSLRLPMRESNPGLAAR